jgi:3-oxoacyl-[acyl-carrier-protein] synthase-3
VDLAGLSVTDIDLFVYHQANSRIIGAVGERPGLGPARVVDVVGRFANMSAASLPISLAAAHREGRLRDGGRVLLVAGLGGDYSTQLLTG